MASKKTKYVCKSCGYETAKWWGICPRCDESDSFEEVVYNKKTEKKEKAIRDIIDQEEATPVYLDEVQGHNYARFSTGIGEFDSVLGGGIVKGSLVLIGGDPGIGKSTILLQLAHNLSKDKKVLYVSAEESLQQIKLRADRLFNNEKIRVLTLAQTSLEIIIETIKNIEPDLVIIDSIQTISSNMIDSLPGSVSQVKEATNILMKVCKTNSISCFIVGHVTKDGSIAGPRVLEHLVDTVLYFEGEKFNTYRMIRGVKNRFGSTNQLGVFEMTQEGLKEVANPSKALLSENTLSEPGTAIVSTIEGTRPLMVEIQALVIPTSFPSPRRTATGVDYNRLNMLLAVLEKRAGIKLQNYDVYVNITGGIKIVEPSIDIGIILAVASSYKNVPVKEGTVCYGEVGLTGEIRSTGFLQQRVDESIKLDFKEIYIPNLSYNDIEHTDKIKIVPVKTVNDVLRLMLSK